MNYNTMMNPSNGMMSAEALREQFPFTLPALVESDFSADDLAADMDGLNLSFPRVKIPAGGSIQFELPTDDPDNPEYSRTLVGVLIHNHPACAYWAEGSDDEENNPPVCSSLDGKVGIGYPGGTCATCEMNKYGTSTKGRGKACKNMRVLYLLRNGEYMPLQINLPPTSLRSFQDFIQKAFILRRRGSCGSLIMISLKKENNGNDYSVAVFRRLYDFAGEELAQILAYSANFKEQIAQMQAQQAEAMQEQRNDLEDIEEADVLPDSGEPFVIGQTIDGDRDGLPD